MHAVNDPDPLKDLPPTSATYEFPPGYLDKAEKLVAGAHAASADPLPGPLLDAFLPELLTAAGIELRPVVAADFAILKRLNSPLLQELKNASLPKDLPKPEVRYDEEDVWELVYLWSHRPPDARALLAKGRQAYREAALAATADKLPFIVVQQGQDIMRALVANVLRAFATKVNHQPAGDSGGNFPSGQQATGLAGGSTT